MVNVSTNVTNLKSKIDDLNVVKLITATVKEITEKVTWKN